VMRCYFRARRPLLQAEGFDLEASERAVQDALEAAHLIERFLSLARTRWEALHARSSCAR